MKGWRCIDPHVHCRDWRESYKATIKVVVELARSQGVVAVLDMPNTEPPVTGPELAEMRLKTAESEGIERGYYTYVAATPSGEQLEAAVEAVRRVRKVAGLKMYTAPMKGLEARDIESQRRVYRRLAELGYRGVLAVHCEKASLFREDLWDPSRPWTWNLARPPEAEEESVRDQISLAIETGYSGTLYIVHVSNPASVEHVRKARENGVRVVCGVTPHHLMLSLDDMERPGGVALKVNPPLREKGLAEKLLECVRAGEIDFLETDHAPHAAWEKHGPPYLSGIRSLENYSRCLDWLLEKSVSERILRDITYNNVKQVFPMIEE
ncbi:MAG: dihydroorotase family protein [Nitrososphaerota archaeon]|nr:dihydroorotase family protein [Candidatus Calditenuaceae archaeon]MDW8073501.1 dihydroorotase family protein [Nitrososphaerota archaeon]